MIMKNLMTLALIGALSVSVTACSKKADTPIAEMSEEQLAKKIAGRWMMEDAIISQQGVGVRMYDSSITYNADGTSAGSAKMEIQIDEMPAEMRGFQMDGTSTWTLNGNVIEDKISTMTVTPLAQNEQAGAMAQAMMAQMQKAPASKATIVSVDKSTMVVNVEGQVLTYSR